MAGTVDLGRELEAYVEMLVKVGRFGSRSEALCEGVRLLREREAAFAALDAAIAGGLGDLEAGRMRPADEVFDRLIAKYELKAKATGL